MHCTVLISQDTSAAQEMRDIRSVCAPSTGFTVENATILHAVSQGMWTVSITSTRQQANPSQQIYPHRPPHSQLHLQPLPLAPKPPELL